MMWNNYQSRLGRLRVFPHVFPIAFPLIFPIGFWLSFALFRLLFPLIIVFVIAALIFFAVRTIQLGNASAAWNSILAMVSPLGQWQQKFTARNQPSQPQQPYYQPSQPQQPYYQPSQPQQPYYQPSQPQQPYYQPSQPQQPYYQPSVQAGQSQQTYERGYTSGQSAAAHEPEQMPPMQQ